MEKEADTFHRLACGVNYLAGKSRQGQLLKITGKPAVRRPDANSQKLLGLSGNFREADRFGGCIIRPISGGVRLPAEDSINMKIFYCQFSGVSAELQSDFAVAKHGTGQQRRGFRLLRKSGGA
ncbi:hypothetical protein D3C75_936490 [compost metagenome]